MQQQVERREETHPEARDELAEVVRRVAGDAESAPQAYLDETVVPEGGE